MVSVRSLKIAWLQERGFSAQSQDCMASRACVVSVRSLKIAWLQERGFSAQSQDCMASRMWLARNFGISRLHRFPNCTEHTYTTGLDIFRLKIFLSPLRDCNILATLTMYLISAEAVHACSTGFHLGGGGAFAPS